MPVTQNALAEDVLAFSGAPLSVNAMDKLQKFNCLQTLGFDGMLQKNKEQFMGLQDMDILWDAYSQASLPTQGCWRVVENLVPQNLQVAKQLSDTSGLGIKVGPSFLSMHNFGTVFSLVGELKDPDAIAAKVSGFLK